MQKKPAAEPEQAKKVVEKKQPQPMPEKKEKVKKSVEPEEFKIVQAPVKKTTSKSESVDEPKQTLSYKQQKKPLAPAAKPEPAKPQMTTEYKDALETVRKLPPFNAYSDNFEDRSYDFEWPNSANLSKQTKIEHLKLKQMRYQQDKSGVIIGLQVFAEGEFNNSPFFCEDKTGPSTTLGLSELYDKEGYYRCDNVAARVESNNTISNLYFNEDQSGIIRVGYKRGKGTLSHVDLEEGEEVIGIYGNWRMVQGRRHGFETFGLIAWSPHYNDDY